jgi:hypothetical protein
VDGGAGVSPPDPRLPAPPAALALLRDALAGERPSTGPWLVVANGREAGRRFPVTGDLVLGRSAAAGLRLADPHVSRRHARIACAGGRVELEDLGSRGGTFRNGSRLRRGVHRLAPGDEIEAGATRLRLVAPLDTGPEAAGERRDGDIPPGATGPTRSFEPRLHARRPGRPAAPAIAAFLLAASALSLALAALA